MRPRLQSRTHAWALAIAVAAGLLFTGLRAFAEPPAPARPTDYAVVANYLAVFCRYVTWPPLPPEEPAGTPLRIGVLGANPFGSALDKVLAGKVLRGRPLVAVYATSAEQLADCQVVFISLGTATDMPDTLAAFAGKPVLTAVYLGETSDTAATGAVIELVRTGSNVRYLLNADALAGQGLQPTPGLLENALRRIGGPAP